MWQDNLNLKITQQNSWLVWRLRRWSCAIPLVCLRWSCICSHFPCGATGSWLVRQLHWSCAIPLACLRWSCVCSHFPWGAAVSWLVRRLRRWSCAIPLACLGWSCACPPPQSSRGYADGLVCRSPPSTSRCLRLVFTSVNSTGIRLLSSSSTLVAV